MTPAVVVVVSAGAPLFISATANVSLTFKIKLIVASVIRNRLRVAFSSCTFDVTFLNQKLLKTI